jgi:hypothetical protein
VLYAVWSLSKSYAHNNNCKKQLVKNESKKKKKKQNKETKEGTQQHREGLTDLMPDC